MARFGNVTDLRTWPIESGEETIAKELSRMSLKELEKAFAEQGDFNVYSSVPYVEKYVGCDIADYPILRIFIEELSNNPATIAHYFANPLNRLKTLKSSREENKKQGKAVRADYEEILANTYRYKALIREIITRWRHDNREKARLAAPDHSLPMVKDSSDFGIETSRRCL